MSKIKEKNIPTKHQQTTTPMELYAYKKVYLRFLIRTAYSCGT